jgi:addiction module HigA family antidote
LKELSMAKQKANVPAEVLKEHMTQYNLTVGKLAEDLDISQSNIRQILVGRTKISLSIACKLEKYFGNMKNFWINTQLLYDLSVLYSDNDFVKSLAAIKRTKKQPPLPTAKAPKASKAAKASDTKKKELKKAKDNPASGEPKKTGKGRGRPKKVAAGPSALKVDEKQGKTVKTKRVKSSTRPSSDAKKKPNSILIKKNTPPPETNAPQTELDLSTN